MEGEGVNGGRVAGEERTGTGEETSTSGGVSLGFFVAWEGSSWSITSAGGACFSTRDALGTTISEMSAKRFAVFEESEAASPEADEPGRRWSASGVEAEGDE